MDWNKRITSQDAQKMMDAYSKVYSPKEEPSVEESDPEEEIDLEAEYYANGGQDDFD